jgi:hypothetical protein
MMKKVDELKIGEEFQLGDRKFRIEEETDGEIEVCVGCFFKDANLECRELQIFNIIPECSFSCRKDKKDVVFKEVKND